MPDVSGAPADRLPDHAVVVRGGLMLDVDLMQAAQTEFDHAGRYAVSVYCTPGRTADQIATDVPLRHSKIRETTVGKLRSAGYEVISSPGALGHADLVLPDAPTDEDWRALDAAFDPPRPNPATMRTDDV